MSYNYVSQKGEILFDAVSVDSRVHERHPELDKSDVVHAWKNAVVYAERVSYELADSLYVAIGLDPKGRILEMVGIAESGGIRIFHAMTPPSKKTMTELGLGK